MNLQDYKTKSSNNISTSLYIFLNEIVSLDFEIRIFKMKFYKINSKTMKEKVL